jgi:phage/plasmid primase-like uncharacterized protein
MHSLENQVMDAGFGSPIIVCDGEIHRFNLSDSKSNDQSGWYVGFDTGEVKIATVGCWKQDRKETFCDKDIRQFSTYEKKQYVEAINQAKLKAKEEKIARHERAKLAVNQLWDDCSDEGIESHKYLLNKRISAHGLKINGDHLLVPLRNTLGELWSVQKIHQDGAKRFYTGGRVNGCYHAIGAPGLRLILCEGYATGASIYEATGEAVAVCFNAGNLKGVVTSLRGKYPNMELLIGGDNDQFNETNVGKQKAQEAAQLVNAKMVMPNFKEADLNGKPTDFNDLHVLYGLEEVNKQLNAGASLADVWDEPIPLPSCEPEGGHLDYNLDLLPDFLHKASAEIARFCFVPKESPATVGLSCLATAIAKKAMVVERVGLEHYPSLFFTLIAKSGERKSPVFSNMQKPLRLYAENQSENHKEQVNKIKTMNEMIEEKIKKEKRKLQKEVSTEDDNVISENINYFQSLKEALPPSPQLFATDITEERLLQKMDDREGAYAVLTGEGRATIDQILGRYTGGGGTGDAIYLAGISGDTITRDRKGGEDGAEERCIYNPCLNVCVMIQPDKYLEVARHPRLRGSGLIARMLTVKLPSLTGTRFEKEDDPGLDSVLMEEYNQVICDLLESKPPEDAKGQSLHKAYLSQEAATARRNYHNSIEGQMADGCEYEDVRDIASKMVSQVAKIALILHLGDNPSLLTTGESHISADTWGRAQELGDYYLNEAVTMQRSASEGGKYEPARKALKWIKDKGFEKISKTMLMQGMPRTNGARPDSKEADSILELLSEYGHLRPESNAAFVVNPLTLS